MEDLKQHVPDVVPSLPTLGGSGGGLTPAGPPLLFEEAPKSAPPPLAPPPLLVGVPPAGESGPLPSGDATGVPTGGPLRTKHETNTTSVRASLTHTNAAGIPAVMASHRAPATLTFS